MTRALTLFAMVSLFVTSSISSATAQESAYANVIVCSDPDCADGVNVSSMEGATITSLDTSGEVIDSCEVVVYPGGMNGCNVTKHAGDGSYQVTPTAAYGSYTMLGDGPVVLESESHGTQLVWYFAPPASEAQVTTPVVVTGLPSTGVGSFANPGVLVVVVPLLLAAIAMIGNRISRR